MCKYMKKEGLVRDTSLTYKDFTGYTKKKLSMIRRRLRSFGGFAVIDDDDDELDKSTTNVHVHLSFGIYTLPNELHHY